MSVHSCLCSTPLISQSEGEKPQIHVELSLPLASAHGEGMQENKSGHISPWICKTFQATREPVWHLPLRWPHNTHTHSPTQLLLAAGIPRDMLRMCFCLTQIFKHPFPQQTPHKTQCHILSWCRAGKKHRREKGNTCSKKLLTT